MPRFNDIVEEHINIWMLTFEEFKMKLPGGFFPHIGLVLAQRYRDEYGKTHLDPRQTLLNNNSSQELDEIQRATYNSHAKDVELNLPDYEEYLPDYEKHLPNRTNDSTTNLPGLPPNQDCLPDIPEECLLGVSLFAQENDYPPDQHVEWSEWVVNPNADPWYLNNTPGE
ncbi:hypothetical protein ACMFMG_011267 [Clarireedia jacksonii]